MKDGVLTLAAIAVAAVLSGESAVLAEEPAVPRIRSIPLDAKDKPYVWLLKGAPETQSFRSGLVSLAPGKSVGLHNSGINEEILVPLEGQGKLRFADHAPLVLKPGLITYAPAHTEHDVTNTGTTILRYIFITAKTE